MARLNLSLPRPLTVLAALAAGLTAFACGPRDAEAYRPSPTLSHHAPVHGQILSVDLETPDGRALSSYWYEGAVYVAGSRGQRYNVRLTNHTAQRVEAVVSVDGRDVISGRLGDYKGQRGYVIDPYGSVTIDGFRQSLDHVASFRFSDVGDSYSARRGTPQHVGVIGVAVFKEQRRRARNRTRPVYPDPDPYPNRRYYEPYGAGAEVDDAGRRSGGKRKSASPAPAASADGRADMDAPPAEAESSRAGSRRSRGVGRDPTARGYAPPPRQNELGTRYGETRYSSVREVQFRRRNRRRPDAMLNLYYDSLEGLRARGVVVDPHPVPYYEPQPDPWPSARGFAPPPRY